MAKRRRRRGVSGGARFDRQRAIKSPRGVRLLVSETISYGGSRPKNPFCVAVFKGHKEVAFVCAPTRALAVRAAKSRYRDSTGVPWRKKVRRAQGY